VSPDLRDPEPITPAHLLYGKRITTLPHRAIELEELDDTDYGGASDLRRRVIVQAAIGGNEST